MKGEHVIKDAGRKPDVRDVARMSYFRSDVGIFFFHQSVRDAKNKF